MGWLDALKQSLDIFDSQVKPAQSPSGNFHTPPSHKADPRELHFTRNALAKMREWHLSETDVKDVVDFSAVICYKHSNE